MCDACDLSNDIKQCAICCEEGDDLYALCSVCTPEDKLCCSKCWSNLIAVRGVDFREDMVQITLKCPWCRTVMSQQHLLASTFAETPTYLRSIHPKLILAIQLLSMDRADLRTIVEQQRAGYGVSDNAYLAWRLQREMRPTSLNEHEHSEHHNRAHAVAMAIAAESGEPLPSLPEGVSAWQNDTGQTH